MKTMTCKQMGGMCEQSINGATADQMMQNGMAHLEQSHPDMANNIKAMSKDDPIMAEWSKKFATDFENTKEN